jgi:predicted CXXCH cytochrome family protein
MHMNRIKITVFIFLSMLLVACDPIARHKVLTTVFDGVPSLPPAEQFCDEYAEKKIAALNSPQVVAKVEEKKMVQHQPYADKNCDSCHDKNSASGLIAERAKLCFVCHTDFIKGSQVHGPVAVGECLACHVPHDGPYQSLLKVSAETLCVTCHKEDRLTAGMHKNAGDHTMRCIDCHNPHFGNQRYFLK